MVKNKLLIDIIHEKCKIKFLNMFVTSKERSLEVEFWPCSSISKCCKLFSYFIHDHHSCCSIILLFQIHEPLSILLQKIYLFLKDPQMEGFDFNNVTFKSLIGLSILQLQEEKWKLNLIHITSERNPSCTNTNLLHFCPCNEKSQFEIVNNLQKTTKESKLCAFTEIIPLLNKILTHLWLSMNIGRYI
jgi:hypothetical protein